MMGHVIALFTAVHIPYLILYITVGFIIHVISKTVNVKHDLYSNLMKLICCCWFMVLFQLLLLFSLFISTARAILTVFTVTALWLEK